MAKEVKINLLTFSLMTFFFIFCFKNFLEIKKKHKFLIGLGILCI